MQAQQSKHGADGSPKDGEFREYFKGGSLSCEGHSRNGDKVGEWKYYLRNGQLRAVGEFVSARCLANGNGIARTASSCRPVHSWREKIGRLEAITLSLKRRTVRQALFHDISGQHRIPNCL
jgi:hypothetical protein